MALNFSHRPIFPAHLTEDNLVSPVRMANGYLVEGISDKNGDGFSKSWHSNHEIEHCFDYGGDRCASQESVSKDILDLLPSDPFGMDISTTFTAITSWLEDLEIDYGGYGRAEVDTGDGNYQLFAGLNFIWNNAMRFQAFPGKMGFEHKASVARGFGGCSDKEVGDACHHGGLGPSCNMEGILSFGNGNAVISDQRNEVFQKGSGYYSTGDVGLGPACNMEGILNFGNKNDVVCDQRKEEFQKDGAFCSNGDVDLDRACNMEGILSYENKNAVVCEQKNEVCQKDGGLYSNGDVGVPHGALIFALDYLGVRDLLVVEKVCRSLRSTVQNDSPLWRIIHIDQPLSEKITDDILLQLTNRAHRNLQCLSLVECAKITDEGLKFVLENNPRLTKLSVPACTRLSIEGIIASLKAFKSMGTQGVTHLRIGGLYGVKQEHFEELLFLLGADSSMLQNQHKPHFYSRGSVYLSYEDERAIDIEMCPRCQKLRLVYDCPAEGCQGKELTQACRACTLCIPRCIECGCCINDSEYEETFCLELLCSDCWKQHRKIDHS